MYELVDDEHDGLILAMEYVEGSDLGRVLSTLRARSETMPPFVGAWIAAETARGLHYAHEKCDDAGTPLSIVHRDVSPQNVLISCNGAVKITDFGIATGAYSSGDGRALRGKCAYMAPEHARGEKSDRRSDIYALGVILREILAGRVIHANLRGPALLDAVRAGVVEPPSHFVSDVPTALEEIAMRALAPDPEARYQSARDMALDLGSSIVARGELVDALVLETFLRERDLAQPWGGP